MEVHTPTQPLLPTSAVTPDPTDVGASNWRSTVLRQAQRLRDELAALPEAAVDAVPRVERDQAAEHVAGADAIARNVPKPWVTFRNWWTGNAVETAWNHLQTAREDLLLIAPSESVRAQLPSILRRLAALSNDAAHDPDVEAIKAIAAKDGELSGEDRQRIRAAHEHVRFAEDDHSEARSFRNNLLIWTVGLAIGAVVLAAIQKTGFNYLSVGAVAGALTTALTWRNLTHLSGPFAISTAQALLKVPAGAVAALLGVLLVRSGVINGLSVSNSTAYGYAAVFGLSQQALTQVVDNAAKKLGS